MRLYSVVRLTQCTVACAMLLVTPSLSAAPHHKSVHTHAVVHKNRVVVARPAPIRTVTTVSTLSLNRLPAGHVRFTHDNETFYFSEGRYYQKGANAYVIVKPRSGFRVAALPRGYRIVREGRATYYTFNNIRYRKVNGFFVVV
jgi:Family of unknown function (DUF6515)